MALLNFNACESLEDIPLRPSSPGPGLKLRPRGQELEHGKEEGCRKLLLLLVGLLQEVHQVLTMQDGHTWTQTGGSLPLKPSLESPLLPEAS